MAEIRSIVRRAGTLAAASALALAGTTGCAARVYTEPAAAGTVYYDDDGYAMAYVEAPPVEIYSAPHVYYDGGYAYWVNDHWYRQTPRGWAYYNSEPQGLQRYRPYVQQAPAAPRGYYRAPRGAYRVPHRGNVAPPAERVR